MRSQISDSEFKDKSLVNKKVTQDPCEKTSKPKGKNSMVQDSFDYLGDSKPRTNSKIAQDSGKGESNPSEYNKEEVTETIGEETKQLWGIKENKDSDAVAAKSLL